MDTLDSFIELGAQIINILREPFRPSANILAVFGGPKTVVPWDRHPPRKQTIYLVPEGYDK
jgi:hypothetical protein